MRQTLTAVTLRLGRIVGNSYAKAWMKAKYVDRRLSLGNVSSGMIILDVGGGFGLDDLLFARKGAYPVVMDLNYDDLKKGKEICKDLNFRDRIDYVVADARKLPFKEGSFEMVTSLSAVEHLPSRYEYKIWIKEMVRVLKNGGKLILTTSNRLWVMYPLVRLLIALKRRSSEHFFSPREIMDELERCNINIEVFDAGIIFSRGYSLVPLPDEFDEALENLLNRLGSFRCMRLVCGRMGFRGSKRKSIF